MRKGKSMSGLKVIGQSDGADLGAVRTLIFDYETSRVLGLLVSEKELFGLIDAQVVPWEAVRVIGKDDVMVSGRDALIKAHDDPRIAEELEGENTLVGRPIHTTDGKDLGTFSDIYFDNDGNIVGYEVSGGLFSDAMSGRHYMPVPESFTLGEDIALVPPEVGTQMEKQKAEEPGGLKGATASAAGAVSETYATAADKVSETYSNIASASVEKQREFVIGRTSSHDVIIPAEKTSPELAATSELESGGMVSDSEILELNTPTMAGSTDVSSSGEPVDGAVLVRKGETITAEHADRAIAADILGSLVLAAGGGTVVGAYDSSKERVGDLAGEHGGNAQSRAEAAAIGKPVAREVTSDDGSIIVTPGMIVTQEAMDRAKREGKENQVIAAAGLGAASESVSSGAQTVKEGAGNLWDTVKEKAHELSESAHDKKEAYDAQAQQKRINDALGRPTTRVILDKGDNVILNTGDLITHKAVDAARAAGVLDVLLDSAYTADPEITPEMLRATEPGQAALPTQAEPTGGPITATVSPNEPAQDFPAQGER